MKWIKNLFKKSEEKSYVTFPIRSIELFSILPKDFIQLDLEYRLPNFEDIKKMASDYAFTKKKQIPELWDCDDYARDFWNHCKKKILGVTVGMVINNTHAFNIFIDQTRTLWIIEPQSGEIMSLKYVLNNKKYKIDKVII